MHSVTCSQMARLSHWLKWLICTRVIEWASSCKQAAHPNTVVPMNNEVRGDRIILGFQRHLHYLFCFISTFKRESHVPWVSTSSSLCPTVLETLPVSEQCNCFTIPASTALVLQLPNPAKTSAVLQIRKTEVQRENHPDTICGRATAQSFEYPE